MKYIQKFCLGSAQFGLRGYGATNTKDYIEDSEIREIFNLVDKYQIQYIDTAMDYGNAETVIGNNLTVSGNSRVITKLAKNSKSFISRDDTTIWDYRLSQSMNLLRKDNLYGLLIHDSNELKKEGFEYLLDWLLRQKEKGLVSNIGVSIYNESEFESIPSQLMDILQIPISIYDQRLLSSKSLQDAKRNGTIVFARSLFLQGLLVSKSLDWPKWVEQKHRDHHDAFTQYCSDNNFHCVDAAINFAVNSPIIDIATIGICSARQLQEIINILLHIDQERNQSWTRWALTDEKLLDPRQWPLNK